MPFVILVILALVGLFVLLPTVTSLFGFVLMLAVWALIGWLAGRLMRGRGFGTLGNILLGLAGGLVGGALFRMFLPWMAGGLIGSVISGVVGAVIVVYLMRIIVRSDFAR